MLLVGRTESVYDYFGGFNLGLDDYDAGDNSVDQVRLTWAMSGFGIQLAIEDPRDRWGTNLSIDLQHAEHRRQPHMGGRARGRQAVRRLRRDRGPAAASALSSA